MNKTLLFAAVAGLAAGYFMASTLGGYQPWKWAYGTGANLGTA